MAKKFNNEEIETYRLIASGVKQKQVSSIQNISNYRVIKNIKSVIKKLNANNKIDAMCKLNKLKYI